MRETVREIFWNWLPGLVAGLMPMLAFLLVNLEVKAPELPPRHPPIYPFYIGLVGHLFILSIVTAAVSIYSSLPRLFSEPHRATRSREASLYFAILLTLILVTSVTLYALFEARVARAHMLAWSGTIAAFAACVSFLIELAIVNIRLSTNGQDHGDQGTPDEG